MIGLESRKRRCFHLVQLFLYPSQTPLSQLVVAWARIKKLKLFFQARLMTGCAKPGNCTPTDRVDALGPRPPKSPPGAGPRHGVVARLCPVGMPIAWLCWIPTKKTTGLIRRKRPIAGKMRCASIISACSSRRKWIKTALLRTRNSWAMRASLKLTPDSLASWSKTLCGKSSVRLTFPFLGPKKKRGSQISLTPSSWFYKTISQGCVIQLNLAQCQAISQILAHSSSIVGITLLDGSILDRLYWYNPAWS